MLQQLCCLQEDPTYPNRLCKDLGAYIHSSPHPSPSHQMADFEDEEKAKTLKKLLSSRNPEDLQAANRLIKNMVKEVMNLLTFWFTCILPRV